MRDKTEIDHTVLVSAERSGRIKALIIEHAWSRRKWPWTWCHDFQRVFWFRANGRYFTMPFALPYDRFPGAQKSIQVAIATDTLYALSVGRGSAIENRRAQSLVMHCTRSMHMCCAARRACKSPELLDSRKFVEIHALPCRPAIHSARRTAAWHDDC